MAAASLDRSGLVEKAASLVQRGDLKAALPQYARLFQENPTDWNVANTLGDLYVRVGKSDDAVEHFSAVAERLAADGFTAKARALYRKILRIQPNNATAKQRVDELDRQGGSASPFLQRVLETARTARESRPEPEPEIAAAAAPEPEAAPEPLETNSPQPETPSEQLLQPSEQPPPEPVHPRLTLVSGSSREQSQPVAFAPTTSLAMETPVPQPPTAPVARAPRILDEFTETEDIVESALKNQAFAPATAAIERFLLQHPHHVRALEKLIEIGVDGSVEAELNWAQVRLAEACLETGRHQQAQDIAIDLIFREPGSTRHQELLDRVTAAAREGRHSLRPVPVFEPLEPPVEAAPTQPAHVEQTASDDRSESAVLSQGNVAPHIVNEAHVGPDADPAADLPADLREWSDPVQAFDDIRTMLLEEAAAAAEERFAESARFAEAGQIDQAVRALEEAMCAPHLRAPAGARLAGMYRDMGAPIEALACLEWVAEMPPPSEESGHELAYQLAVTLEALGQQAQALGVYRELLAEVGPSYRDVATRAERLTAA